MSDSFLVNIQVSVPVNPEDYDAKNIEQAATKQQALVDSGENGIDDLMSIGNIERISIMAGTGAINRRISYDRCPFCGSQTATIVTDDAEENFQVSCKCGALGPERKSALWARKAWNLRK